MTSAVNVEMTFRTPSGAEERVKIDAGNGKADDSSFQTWKQGEEPPKVSRQAHRLYENILFRV